MTFQSLFLNRFNNISEVPIESYIFYDLNKGKFWINVKDYSDFVAQWIGVSNPLSLTMDLSSACMHSIILDFDCKISLSNSPKFICEIIESILKITLLPSVNNFTFIVASRKGSKGVHVHLPEFQIGHDDYILFCESLKYKFQQSMTKDEHYILDILTNAMLPGASKPNCHPYIPFLLVYIDERNTFRINIFRPKQESLEHTRKNFTKRKDNENSIFRKILLNQNSYLFNNEIKHYMMPVIIKTQTKICTIVYPTTIGTCYNNSLDCQDVANFINKKSNEKGFISKSKRFVFNAKNSLKVYHYLKLNAKNMKAFETNNHAIKMWFQRFNKKNLNELDNLHIPELFRDLHDTLQFEHSMLAKNSNPIKTILEFNEGYYFLPIFYALCQHYGKDSLSMVKLLYPILSTKFHSLLDKIQSVHPDNIKYAIKSISVDTIHFCANNLYKQKPKTHREKLKSIIDNNQRAILSVTTQDQLVDLIRSIQDRHLPIRVLKIKKGLKKPVQYIWNALAETWQEINMVREVADHINNLWTYIKQYITEYHSSGGVGGPDDELLYKFNVVNVVSSIMSDTSMERKDIQMDTHKWFLRLHDGSVLDLLTGHIGGVVPEFFLSDRKMNLSISRKEMMLLCDSSKHFALYENLTDHKFFLKYLQNLFLDTTDNLFDTLYNLLDDVNDDLSISMMHFYINICKCTSFEYDVLLYMLDILASVYIGTNYERKFFVLKGLTRNGKSKLFELMGYVLGGYYHSIQSENLAPGHSLNTASPELASTLFSCRMVTTEELDKKLDENRIKQITGNSSVSYRNLYEANSGGIPTAKLFSTTNNYPECKASEAFKDRVVAIPFDAEFTDIAPEKTSKQVETNTYMKDVYVVEQSYKGCFFILYYHLKKFMKYEDGLLHYRQIPIYVFEFTQNYLFHADVYIQFIITMDVQPVNGAITPINDVRSAIRQFLKMTKNTSIHESDIFSCFEKQFNHLRCTDINLETESYTSIVDEDEDEPLTKKKKTDDSLLVYYVNLAIKNMKRVSLDC